jgi:maleamate amidohydrolase
MSSQTPDSSEEFFARHAHLMTADEIAGLRRFGVGRRIGFGRRAALLVIDAQKYMVEPKDPAKRDQYPAACSSGSKAVPVIASLATAFRAAGAPVIYTRNLLRRDGADRGLKRFPAELLALEGWFVEGSVGVQFIDEVAPTAQDLVITKPKPSAFHGTALTGLLIDRGIDTVVITGGATSNCVRATAIDASAYNLRTVVVRDAVFDRVSLSHEVSLMDIDRQMGDVVDSDEVFGYLRTLATQAPA